MKLKRDRAGPFRGGSGRLRTALAALRALNQPGTVSREAVLEGLVNLAKGYAQCEVAMLCGCGDEGDVSPCPGSAGAEDGRHSCACFELLASNHLPGWSERTARGSCWSEDGCVPNGCPLALTPMRAVIPVHRGGEPAGALLLGRRGAGFTRGDIVFLEALLESVGAGLSRGAAESGLLRTVIGRSRDGFILCTLDGKAVLYNEAMQRISGFTAEEIASYGWFDLVYPDLEDRDRAMSLNQEAVAGGLGYTETQITTKAGALKWVSLSLTPLELYGRTMVFMTVTDITDRKEAEARLTHLSMHDPLTGLHNRASLEAELQRLTVEDSYPVSMISVDVDGLKLINDVMGHIQGDSLLKACARTLRRAVRKSDMVARTGGDEFVVILPHTGRAAAAEVRKRIGQELSAHNQRHPSQPLSLSLGLATADSAAVKLEETLKAADRDMYKDKKHRSRTVHGIVRALQTVLAAKDYISAGHVARVLDLSWRLGVAAGLPKQDLADLRLFAEVHDLGKMGIPDHILFKPSSLSDSELEQVQLHVTVGYEIAKSTPQLAHIADFILHHHEWWDGGGYPGGVRGEDIPLPSRILAIADAYDIITTGRPYRPAVSRADALAELRRCAGTQFDPRLVELFATEVEPQAAPPGESGCG
ncbi:MAG: diguanylate cyclase [Bacillota bacterium]